jgi:hypothetical protein
MLKWNKKIICLILVLVLSLSSASMVVNAGPLPSSQDVIVVKPCLLYINYFTNHFAVRDGIAYLGSVLGSSGVDHVRITMYLLQFKDGYWQPNDYWTDIELGTYMEIDGLKVVALGYNYKMVSYAYCYINGNIVDSTVFYSIPWPS